MAEVVIKIPDDFKELVAGAGETIYVEAIKDVARRRLGLSVKRLKEMSRKISAYEAKYGKTYTEFLDCVPDTLKGHDDWMDWTYLMSVSVALEKKIDKIRLLTGN
jgi:hypothetical protein